MSSPSAEKGLEPPRNGIEVWRVCYDSRVAFRAALFLLLLASAACNSSVSGSETDAALRNEIRANGLTGDPAAGLQ